MKKILAFLFILIVTSFADDKCTEARNQFLFTIPPQETISCHVLGAVPGRRDIMGFFVEMIDGSKIVAVYEEGYEEGADFVFDEYSLKFIRCIEDDGKFSRQFMTSQEIVDKLLSFTACNDSSRFSVVPDAGM